MLAEEKMLKYIVKNLEISSNESDKEDSDEKHSDEENSNK